MAPLKIANTTGLYGPYYILHTFYIYILVTLVTVVYVIEGLGTYFVTTLSLVTTLYLFVAPFSFSVFIASLPPSPVVCSQATCYASLIPLSPVFFLFTEAEP